MPTLADLKPDPKNARRHTPRNVATIEQSLQRYGFGRSLLIANDGTIIAGNATAEACGNVGLEDAIVVESDGTRPIAIKRTDVAPDTEVFRGLSLSDNRSAELADGWIGTILAEYAKEDDLSWLWREDEFAAAIAIAADDAVTPPDDFGSYDETIATEHRCPACGYEWSGKST